MATLTVTKDKGGVSRPEGMTVLEPAQTVPLAQLKAIGKQAGLDGLFVADLVSALAMHERHSARVALAAAEQTERPKRRKVYEKLAQLHAERTGALESLLTQLKLPALYVSPVSRAAGHLVASLAQAPLLAGSVDAEGRECMLLDVAFLLAEQSLANTEVLTSVAAAAERSTTKTALAKTAKLLAASVATFEKVRTLRKAATVDAARK
ncbi:hypothetical protein SAMN02745121_07686 [Nannocystis exedens]|uniref:Uncharacterized protein n=1 Tax=Nannocystis exedens TaxID=54 RepID=A0A1I2H4W0_9BACT|nr:hypothetical protein [Nannocystis exedens]PCC74027.1 hypothetical protein NAEX_07116 [Nannocystis exedens]SFF24410.1 hypothetical protein SAMN02745121_07686 [Nannocystis exedens]